MSGFRLLIIVNSWVCVYIMFKRLLLLVTLFWLARAYLHSVEIALLLKRGLHLAGGAKPNLADLAVFGVFRPIRHLQTGEDMLASTNIGDWYSRMEDAVGPSCRLQEEPLMSTIENSMKV